MLARNFHFDTCQLPLNCFDASFRSFEHAVLPMLAGRGIAPIGMKSLGGDGRFELYKTTAMHEGPVGRKQHGFPGDDEVAA